MRMKASVCSLPAPVVAAGVRLVVLACNRLKT
jgi:hypothetical protein